MESGSPETGWHRIWLWRAQMGSLHCHAEFTQDSAPSPPGECLAFGWPTMPCKMDEKEKDGGSLNMVMNRGLVRRKNCFKRT